MSAAQPLSEGAETITGDGNGTGTAWVEERMATAKTASRGATKAAAKARALEKARVRRIELDKERDARDRRL